jgi:hypothetical protein
MSDFEDDMETGKNAQDAILSNFQPVPPMRPPQPMSLPSASIGSHRQPLVHAPTNASLARGPRR